MTRTPGRGVDPERIAVRLGWADAAQLKHDGRPAAGAGRQPQALPARPDDPLTRVEDWVTQWADRAADDLLATGEATITTCRGTVRARLARPGHVRSGWLNTESRPEDDGWGSGGARLSPGSEQELREQELREQIRHRLIFDITGLVGG